MSQVCNLNLKLHNIDLLNGWALKTILEILCTKGILHFRKIKMVDIKQKITMQRTYREEWYNWTSNLKNHTLTRSWSRIWTLRSRVMICSTFFKLWISFSKTTQRFKILNWPIFLIINCLKNYYLKKVTHTSNRLSKKSALKPKRTQTRPMMFWNHRRMWRNKGWTKC